MTSHKEDVKLVVVLKRVLERWK